MHPRARSLQDADLLGLQDGHEVGDWAATQAAAQRHWGPV